MAARIAKARNVEPVPMKLKISKAAGNAMSGRPTAKPKTKPA